MKPVKRIEIVLPKKQVEQVVAALDEGGSSGYTVIRDVLGRGERGLRSGSDLGVSDHHYILVACSEDEAGQIIETVRPILRRHGGVCLVSDAQWVIH